MPQSVDKKIKTANIIPVSTAQTCRKRLKKWDLAHLSGVNHVRTSMLASYTKKKIVAAPEK